MTEPTLILRKVTDHAQASNAYRVVYDGVEVGSIGEQLGAGRRQFWSWSIDTVLPPDKTIITRGEGGDLNHCMLLFKEAWHKFSRNPERLADFMQAKKDSKRPWVK